MGLKSSIESLLFISAKPMSVKQLADLTKKKSDEIKKAGDDLVEDYKSRKCGISIIKNGSKYQMVSSPENAKLIQAFIKDETTGELSRPSLETLTVIAYRGPISKIDLDRIRGVNCSLILRNLLIRGLIEAKTDKVKNETYYNISFDFIRFLGVNDINELPDYEKLSRDDTIDRLLNEGNEGEQTKNEKAEDEIMEEVEKIDDDSDNPKIDNEQNDEDIFEDEEEDDDEYEEDEEDEEDDEEETKDD